MAASCSTREQQLAVDLARADLRQVLDLFSRQAIPMVWDFPETNPFCESAGSFTSLLESLIWRLRALYASSNTAAITVSQGDAMAAIAAGEKPIAVCTDPPYYDNIGYADLSDFFYVWLRRSIGTVWPALMSTVLVPKIEELIASPYRCDGSKAKAKDFFEAGLGAAFTQMRAIQDSEYPLVLYYAFKQAEDDRDSKTVEERDRRAVASTGWETMLSSLVEAGFSVTGTWPVRTERTARSVGQGTNALASSVVLVCRPRPVDARTATRRELLQALKTELPVAVKQLQDGNIAPVDLAQSAIGPGMAIYTRYASVFDAGGKPLMVRDALALINQTLDEALAEQEGDFDADTRWALAWFEQLGLAEGEYGVAETLSKAKNTSVQGLMDAGVLKSSRGKVRLLAPKELSAAWTPGIDPRLTAWGAVHHLIRALEAGGEPSAAALVAQLGSKAEVSRELAYRLYTICERRKRAAEALSYNGLVQSWPEITRLAREGGKPRTEQSGLFEDGEE